MAEIVKSRGQNRAYTFALVFKSRDPQALNHLCEEINELIPDCWVVFKHGPSLRHLWVVEAQAPKRGEAASESNHD